MVKIFVSYRQEDTKKDAGRIYDRLVAEFGKDNVFKDVHSIPAGRDSREVLTDWVNRSNVMLVLIGTQWLTLTETDGTPRIHNPSDFVHYQINLALRSSTVRVIPVIIAPASLPESTKLPEALRELAYLRAVSVRDDPDFNHDVDGLIKSLKATSSNNVVSEANQKTEKSWWERLTEGQGILIAAVIAGIFTLAVAWIEYKGNNPSTLTPESTASVPRVDITEPSVPMKTSSAIEQTEIMATSDTQSTTDTQGTSTQSAINTQTAMNSEQTQQPTTNIIGTGQDEPLVIAEQHVNSNDEWIPYIQDFNGVEMVLVPTGCFDMGSNVVGPDEQPVHGMCIDTPFWIDQTEVTQEQFRRFDGVAENESYFSGDNRPVEKITWFEAQNFCELRDARLPTEAEWEYAARGPDELIYPWGNQFIAENVVYQENSNGETAIVGSRMAGVSWVGALDMSGNVWEWVSSLYQEYPYGSDHESATNNTDMRVLRSGSWDDNNISSFRTDFRNGNNPYFQYQIIGFRCARDI